MPGRSVSVIAVALVTATALAACGSSGDDADPADAAADAPPTLEAPSEGLATVSPNEIADVLADPPDGLVILDVRTPQEFAEARIEGATMLDFYEDSFAAELAELDRDTPYVLYCRSGNRSGQALQMMRDLGFTSVSEADGGIVAWAGAGLPTVSD